jgi:hypothetical protein
MGAPAPVFHPLIYLFLNQDFERMVIRGWGERPLAELPVRPLPRRVETGGKLSKASI